MNFSMSLRLNESFLLSIFLRIYLKLANIICHLHKLVSCIIKYAMVTYIIFISHNANAQLCSITMNDGSDNSANLLLKMPIDTITNVIVNCSGDAFSTIGMCLHMGKGSSVINSLNTSGPRADIPAQHGPFLDAVRTQPSGSQVFGVAENRRADRLASNLQLNQFGTGSKILALHTRLEGDPKSLHSRMNNWVPSTPQINYGYGIAPCDSGPTDVSADAPYSSWTELIASSCDVSAGQIDLPVSNQR